MTMLVRSAVLSNFAEVARSVGLDPYEMVVRAGLHPACLSERDLKIPVRAMRQLLEDSAALSNVDNFGLRMAETRRLSVFGELGMAVRDAPTLRHLMSFLFGHMSMHNEALRLHMESYGEATLIRWDSLDQEQGAVSQSVELTLGALARIISIYQDDDDRHPYRACFIHRRRMNTDLHRRIFGKFLEFESEFDGLICENAVLDAPLASADPVMASYSSRMLESALPQDQSDIQREVRQLIVILLPKGRCSLDRVARHLGVGRQTLHRQLAREGTLFSDLTQQIRSELSNRYLGQSNRSLSQIALLLGFSELSGYSRWHQNVLGETPSACRDRLVGRHR